MYILKISNTAFIKMDDNVVSIMSEPETATSYKTIGEAMREASSINKRISAAIVRVLPVY